MRLETPGERVARCFGRHQAVSLARAQINGGRARRKLTEAQAAEIRSRDRAAEPRHVVGKRYGVSEKTIRWIDHGLIYRTPTHGRAVSVFDFARVLEAA